MRRPAPPPAGATQPPLVLGIESATAFGGVAVVSAEGLLGETTLRGAESHAERLLPAVEHLLGALGTNLGAIAAVAVSCGPGSFTGLRTGVATAKGLALSRGLPLYGIPTLEALAANAPAGSAPVAALVNARRGEFFRALFRPAGAGLAAAGEEHLVTAGAALEGLPEGCIVVGEPPPGFEARRATGSGGVILAPAHLRFPRAGVVAAKGLERFLGAEPSELASLRPRYLRPPDARLPEPRAAKGICQH